MKLSKNDYLLILKYYNISIPDNSKLKYIKNIADDLIAQKLCSCIQNVEKLESYKDKSISICINSVLSKKNLKINRYTCKRKAKINNLKLTKNKIKINTKK